MTEETKTQGRRRRRNRLKARITGALAAVQGLSVTANPYQAGTYLSNQWLVGHALKLAEIFNNE